MSSAIYILVRLGPIGSSQGTSLGVFGQQNTLATSTNAGPPPFTKSTKFNDLPDNMKAVLEQIE